MYSKCSLVFSVAVALGVALCASPAEAQGKGKGPKHRAATHEEWSDERYRDGVWYPRDDEWGDYGGRRGKRVPPGWCKGRGNPHNTVENCGFGARGRYDDYGRYGDYDRRGRYGSYEEAHQDFHRWLDYRYSELAARRPLDLPYQIRLRAEKSAEHARWHRRVGRGH